MKLLTAISGQVRLGYLGGDIEELISGQCLFGFWIGGNDLKDDTSQDGDLLLAGPLNPHCDWEERCLAVTH